MMRAQLCVIAAATASLQPTPQIVRRSWSTWALLAARETPEGVDALLAAATTQKSRNFAVGGNLSYACGNATAEPRAPAEL